jgi:peptidoglycan/LPS O-acetylase OafA/YrhL
MIKDLDFRDTTILKGMAILAIVLHNFFHVVSPVQENEFTFDPSRVPIFLNTITHPEMAIQAVFAFYGHFGVQIFIFLSAYGLAKSHWDKPETWVAFMRDRIKKLYPTSAMVILPWLILLTLQSPPLFIIKRIIPAILLMLIGLSNILPGYGLPPVGPWWFIPFITQFYAIWFLLRKVTIKFGWHGLLMLSIMCAITAYGTNLFRGRPPINLLFTPLGRMPVLCFGIVAAKYRLRMNGTLALSACGLVLLGSIYAALWPLVSTSATIAILWTYLKIRGTLRTCRTLERIGRYSLVIFLVNGIVRVPFLPLARSPQSQLLFGCVSAVVSFTVAALIHELMPRSISACVVTPPECHSSAGPDPEPCKCRKPKAGELVCFSCFCSQTDSIGVDTDVVRD